MFAAENETECLQWMEAFDAAVTIQVSKVDNMEQIRINDSDLITKWNSLERGLGEVRAAVGSLYGHKLHVSLYVRTHVHVASTYCMLPIWQWSYM